MPKVHKPPSLHPPSSNWSDDEVGKSERDDVERRRWWLSNLPQTYTPKHRERYVFLHLNNTTVSLFTSRLLFRSVPGATCPHDVRLDFKALTDHLCGAKTSAVFTHQLATTHSKAKPKVAQALKKLGWTLKAVGNDENELRTQLLTQLHRGATTANEKTLVLAMGGSAFGTGNVSACQDLVAKFLVEGWHVEIHAWLRALSDGFLRLQKENSGRLVVKPLDDIIHDIVFLDKKKSQSKRTTTKHVCSKLKYGQAPSKVVASPVSETDSTKSPHNTDNSSRAASVSPTQRHAHTIPPATSPNASWIMAATYDQETPSSASDTSSVTSSSFTSPFIETAPFLPTQPRLESPFSPTFVPPLPPLPSPTRSVSSMFQSPLMSMPSQPVYRWMFWELQLQQVRDLMASQQADLAMRQCVLQQTTELMRLMLDQEKKMRQPFVPDQPPNAALNTWGSTYNF